MQRSTRRSETSGAFADRALLLLLLVLVGVALGAIVTVVGAEVARVMLALGGGVDQPPFG